MNNNAEFFAAYDRWLEDCLAEYNHKFGENRQYHTAPKDYHPGELVEFSEAGDAYPHGIGGVGHIPNAVTPWNRSPHNRWKHG